MRGNKPEVLHHLLCHGSVYVHIDSRVSDVWVPKACRGRAQLVLQVGFSLALPVQDFKMTPEGWSATLSFDRQPFHCSIPWKAVYCMVGDDAKGFLWDEDVPPEVDMRGGEEKPEEKRKTLPPNWRVIDGGKSAKTDAKPQAG